MRISDFVYERCRNSGKGNAEPNDRAERTIMRNPRAISKNTKSEIRIPKSEIVSICSRHDYVERIRSDFKTHWQLSYNLAIYLHSRIAESFNGIRLQESYVGTVFS